MTVDYLEITGLQELLVSFSGPDITKQQIPVNKLFRCNWDLPGDLSGDCQVDMDDLNIVAQNWLNGYTVKDLSAMAADWLE